MRVRTLYKSLDVELVGSYMRVCRIPIKVLISSASEADAPTLIISPVLIYLVSLSTSVLERMRLAPEFVCRREYKDLCQYESAVLMQMQLAHWVGP